MRQMSGKIEELQFQNQQLREQLKRFQEDTEFRFQDSGRGRSGGRGSRPPPPHENAPPRQIVMAPPAASPPAPSPVTPAPRVATRGDVFDPEADPGAPGAPRPLGSPESAAPPPTRRSAVPGAIMNEPDGLPGDPATPLDIAGIGNQAGATRDAGAPARDLDRRDRHRFGACRFRQCLHLYPTAPVRAGRDGFPQLPAIASALEAHAPTPLIGLARAICSARAIERPPSSS